MTTPLRQLSLLFFTLLAASGLRAEIVDIDNAELARLIAAGTPVIDIRTAPEWQETGIVPGSHLLTFFDERGRADPAGWLNKARAIAAPEQPVVVICRSGNRTKAVSRLMSQQAGYGTVYNVRDGIRAWRNAGLPTQSAAPVLAECRKDNRC